MENAVIVVEVLHPSLPSLVSLVPSLVCVSKKTPPVGSKSRGACMNHPHHFCGSVSEQWPNSSKNSLIGKKAFFLESGTRPFFVIRTHESGRYSRSSTGSQISSPTIRYPSVASFSSELSRNSRGSRRLPIR